MTTTPATITGPFAFNRKLAEAHLANPAAAYAALTAAGRRANIDAASLEWIDPAAGLLEDFDPAYGSDDRIRDVVTTAYDLGWITAPNEPEAVLDDEHHAYACWTGPDGTGAKIITPWEARHHIVGLSDHKDAFGAWTPFTGAAAVLDLLEQMTTGLNLAHGAMLDAAATTAWLRTPPIGADAPTPGTPEWDAAVHELTGRNPRTARNVSVRVLHLGIVAKDRQYPDATPPAFTCHITEDVPVVVAPGEDSYVRWGNLDDPLENHDDDGTRHVEIAFFEGQTPADWGTERDWGLAVHAHLERFLAAYAPTWRAADYVVWTDDAVSENSRTDVAL